jgi:hypothetical protein
VFGFVTKLFFYHIKLICYGESTYENLKGHFKGVIFHPYKKNCCSAFSEVFCKKKPQKFFNFREPEAEKLPLIENHSKFDKS